ncbi:MAG: hypothetical protein OEV60_13700 [Actinomycetota bacterium]|nr:hypothetical protein [Actinomycetota bacterium]
MRGAIFALASCLHCLAASADSDEEPAKAVVVAMEELHPTVRSASGAFTLELKGS